MSGFDVSAIQFPSNDFSQAATAFSNYVESLPTEARTSLGEFMLNLSSGETHGSPQSEFVHEALRWTGQSLIDGQWNSTPLNVSSTSFAAAAVEFGTDAMIGAALGLGIIAAFWALPVGLMVPGSIIGGYLAGQIAGFLPLIPLLAPFAGKLARGWAVDALKDIAGADLHDAINDLYWKAGSWIAEHLIDPLVKLLTDPLVIDLDGDGVELTSLDGDHGCYQRFLGNNSR